jgi:hypothetical protein
MSSYRAKALHDIALVSLTTLSPQPRSVGVQAVERSYGLSGAVQEQGLYIELVYDYIETPTEYAALLTLLGLTSVLFAPVTIYAWSSAYGDVRYNATAVRPQIGQDAGWTNYFLRNVTFLFKDLEALSEP